MQKTRRVPAGVFEALVNFPMSCLVHYISYDWLCLIYGCLEWRYIAGLLFKCKKKVCQGDLVKFSWQLKSKECTFSS